MPPVRIASTSYLNALPLTWGFTEAPSPGRFELSFHPPAVCAEMLRDRRADVALIPSIEYQRIPGLRVLPGIGIGSRGRVGSVILLSRVRFTEIASVAIDSESRTAAALLQILLRRAGAPPPRLTPMPADRDRMLRGHDAALIIGDRALRSDPGDLRVYDLAWEWRSRTGLPFVFAIWAVGPGTGRTIDPQPFLASRRAGLAAIDEIAARHAGRAGLEPARVARYLRVNLSYDLGTEELQSLERFYGLAREQGLAGGHRPVALYRAERPGVVEAAGTP